MREICVNQYVEDMEILDWTRMIGHYRRVRTQSHRTYRYVLHLMSMVINRLDKAFFATDEEVDKGLVWISQGWFLMEAQLHSKRSINNINLVALLADEIEA